MRTTISRPRYRRAGFHLVETSIAMLLLSSLLMVVLAFSRHIGMARQDVLQRTVVLQQCSNLVDRLCAIPHDELNSGALPNVNELLGDAEVPPGVKFELAIEPETGEGESRLVVRATWDQDAGKIQRPIEVVAWTYGSP